MVAANELWTAFVPAAARWPFEVHLYPHRQVPDLAALSEAERSAFAPLYTSVLRALDGLFDVADAVHLGLAPGAGAAGA